MAKLKRTPEEVCIAYAAAAKAVRDITKRISPCECIPVVAHDAQPWNGQNEDVRPCISQLFSVTHEADGYGGDLYEGKCEDIEAEMCDRCLESLKAVRDRKKARIRLGAAKRAVEAIGKRLSAEAANG